MDVIYDMIFVLDSIITIVLKLMILIVIHLWIIWIRDPLKKKI